MALLIDSFWRAAAYCLHWRVILLSLLPLLLSALLAAGLGYFYWEAAIDAVSAALREWSLIDAALGWLDAVGGGTLRALVAPLLVLALVLPLLVVVVLLAVALLMLPRLVALVAARRFPLLEKREGEPAWRVLLASAGATLLALLALVVSMPLWLIPPLVLLLPPLIWGWLAYRVMTLDALAAHASRDERLQIMREHRLPLLGIGVVSGYLGAAPALVWALGALALAFAPLLIIVSMWLYTLVFAFSALWFSHYALAALDTLRRGAVVAPAALAGAVLPAAAPQRPPV
jgi:hypothetical protein